MSLFSLMEICEPCKYAVIHDCCGSFCYCTENHTGSVDYCKGICEYNSERGESKHKDSNNDR